MPQYESGSRTLMQGSPWPSGVSIRPSTSRTFGAWRNAGCPASCSITATAAPRTRSRCAATAASSTPSRSARAAPSLTPRRRSSDHGARAPPTICRSCSRPIGSSAHVPSSRRGAGRGRGWRQPAPATSLSTLCGSPLEEVKAAATRPVWYPAVPGRRTRRRARRHRAGPQGRLLARWSSPSTRRSPGCASATIATAPAIC